MNPLSVRMEQLGPMRVSSVHVVSEHPEIDAWESLKTWAEPRGLLQDPSRRAIYGFNNPNPSSNRKEYGYEFWICVDSDTTAEAPVEIKEFAGGRYAVTTHHGCPTPQLWK